ncbi:MAG: V-type ATP synthase subunit I [Clostridia bacterium]|nr:V-type ATP synthase subunit I [Clostridia bacterium]
MAVLQMQRISICGMKKDRKAILEQLQELGAVEVNLDIVDDIGMERMETAPARANFEKNARQAAQALQILQHYVPEKSSIFSSFEGKKLEDENIYGKGAQLRDYFSSVASQLISLDKQIAELKAANLKLENQIESLGPWMSLDVPMNCKGTKTAALMKGTMPGLLNLEQVYSILTEHAPDADAVDIEILSQDKDFTYMTVLCPRADAQKVEEALRSEGFSRPSYLSHRTPADKKVRLEGFIKENTDEIEKCRQVIEELAKHRDNLKLMEDYFRIRADKYEVLGQLPQTKQTFFISGYVPKYVAERVASHMEEQFDAVVGVEELKEDEEPPVILHNNGFSESMEGVVSSFGLPKKGEVDPTTVMSFFYVFLFGLMLSDAAYGLIVMIACAVMLKKFPKMSTNMHKSLKMFFWCGVSTLFWGVMFGGYFGDIVDVVGKTFFGVQLAEGQSLIPALWFVPLNDPMKMLMYSMLFGVIHLFTGLAMKGYMCLKDKKYMDFVCDVVFWFMLLLGLIFMLLSTELFASLAGAEIVFPAFVLTLAKALAIVGAVGILFFSGRSSKNFGIRIALGAYDLYGITSWLSDVLSYSRLLALGLATGVIASVVNQMGSVLAGSIPGVIGFIIVFIAGHLLNLGINLLGAYVHTCRLQYVEFFGKFYEGGGKAFNPFRANTKYVEIKEETKL